jgi:energy-coupling factor transporter ATP-binding protein EcfA2
MIQDGNPQSVLSQSITDRLAYFHRYTMAHPKLLDAAHTLMQAIEEPAGISLIFLFGPSGVGKSTLLRRLQQRLLEAAQPNLEIDKGRIPIAGIEAATPEFSNFDWKDFYLRGLAAIQAPSMELVQYSLPTTLKLRFAFEQGLEKRRLTVFYVDEAQNLAKVASGRKLRDQTDCIKSLANLTRVQFILAGTYELLVLRNLNAQLCRRSLDIHFSRYRAENPDDLAAFRNIVQTFQRQLPVLEEPDLVRHWEFCFERSLGCVGILKDWLSRALSVALSENATTLTLKHLELQAWSLDRCSVMLAEAKEGEDQLNPPSSPSQLRMALGLDPAPPETHSLPSSTAVKRSKQKVGQPRPQRRPIQGGTQQDGVPHSV